MTERARSQPPERKIKGLLFDKDGTLLDYWVTWIPINREVALFAAHGDAALAAVILREGGHDPDTDHVAPGTPFAAAGMDGIAAQMATTLRRRGLPVRCDLLAGVDRIFREGGARYAAPIAGARDAVVALRDRGFAVGLATNDSFGGLVASMTKLAMIDLFAFKVGCDSGHGAKPGPGMVHAFATASGLTVAEIAVIGDSTHDMEMAANAGVGLRVAVLSGTGRAADLTPHCDLVLASVADMPGHPRFASA